MIQRRVRVLRGRLCRCVIPAQAGMTRQQAQASRLSGNHATEAPAYRGAGGPHPLPRAAALRTLRAAPLTMTR